MASSPHRMKAVYPLNLSLCGVVWLECITLRDCPFKTFMYPVMNLT